MWPAECHGMFWTSLPVVSGGEMSDTQEEQWHGVGRRTMAGVFSLDRPGIFWLLLVLLFWLWFGSESLCRGSLTQRCGRGESAIRGRAVGFRVGHREGHWAGHWGRWRQQEGAWHFALAAPVRLQTTQKGSGGRHATIRGQGMKRTQLRRPGPKNIHDGRGGGRKEGEEVCGGKTSKGMMNVDGKLYGSVENNNHHGIDRSGCWSSRWKDPQGGGVPWWVEEESEHTDWLVGFSRKMARNEKNHGKILVYTSTTPPTMPAPNNRLERKR